jgi:hypothetical protein
MVTDVRDGGHGLPLELRREGSDTASPSMSTILRSQVIYGYYPYGGFYAVKKQVLDRSLSIASPLRVLPQAGQIFKAGMLYYFATRIDLGDPRT